MIIDILRDEFDTWQKTLPVSAFSEFEEFTHPSGAARSTRVAVETSTRVAEAIVWDSGAADLVIGNLASGEVEAIEHMELTTRVGVRGLLEDMARLVVR
jgi:hypothetical protein